jgi:hypothetical protein
MDHNKPNSYEYNEKHIVVTDLQRNIRREYSQSA